MAVRRQTFWTEGTLIQERVWLTLPGRERGFDERQLDDGCTRVFWYRVPNASRLMCLIFERFPACITGQTLLPTSKNSFDQR
jgi:hypothetical protein